MSLLVGYAPEPRGRGALHLARSLSLSSGLPLVVCCVIPDRWRLAAPVSESNAAPEALDEQAAPALAKAAAVLSETPVEVTYDVTTARSESAGLLAAVERHDARMLVAGSSADGHWGHIALGSVTDRLLHSSPVPIAIAPRGYRADPEQRIERVTVAVDGTDSTHAVLERAATIAHDAKARLRVVVFAVHPATMYPPRVSIHIEDDVVREWHAEAMDIARTALAGLKQDVVKDADPIAATGESWAEALDEPGWADGDLLVLGSSGSQSMLSRVFLGSTASRILRHSPVPTVVVP